MQVSMVLGLPAGSRSYNTSKHEHKRRLFLQVVEKLQWLIIMLVLYHKP